MFSEWWELLTFLYMTQHVTCSRHVVHAIPSALLSTTGSLRLLTTFLRVPHLFSRRIVWVCGQINKLCSPVLQNPGGHSFPSSHSISTPFCSNWQCSRWGGWSGAQVTAPLIFSKGRLVGQPYLWRCLPNTCSYFLQYGTGWEFSKFLSSGSFLFNNSFFSSCLSAHISSQEESWSFNTLLRKRLS